MSILTKPKYLLIILTVLLMTAACQTWLTPFTPAMDAAPTVTATPVMTGTPVVNITPTPTSVSGTPIPRTIILRLWVPEFLDPEREDTNATSLLEQLYAYTDNNYTIQVQVVAKYDKGPGGLYNLLSTAYDAAPTVLPDLIVLNQADLKLAATNGYLMALDGYNLPAWDYFPFAVESVTVDETLYGIPYLSYADQIIYRDGITTTAPISWTSVISGGYSLLFPASADLELANDALLAMYIGSGGQVIDATGQPSLDRRVLEDVYGFFVDMIAQGLINTQRALTLNDSLASWAVYQEGVGAISPVPVGAYWQQVDESSLPGWIPTASGSPAVMAQTWGLAIVTADGYRYSESLKLAEYLSLPANQGYIAQQIQLVPTRRQSIATWGLKPVDTAFLNGLMTEATLAFPTNIDTSVRRALQAGLVAILSQDVETPEQAATYALTNLRR